ncbi:MAG: agmatinase family protein [Nitriliruptorales bacterium]
MWPKDDMLDGRCSPPFSLAEMPFVAGLAVAMQIVLVVYVLWLLTRIANSVERTEGRLAYFIERTVRREGRHGEYRTRTSLGRVSIEDPHWPRASAWLARGDDDPALVVVGVPSSAASISPSEAWRAPAALREVLGRFSTFHGEEGLDLSDLTVADLGDWDVVDLDPVAMIEEVDRLTRALPAGSVRVFLGGDNAITRPVARAGGPLDQLGVLTFDAHHDVRVTEPVPSNGSPIRGLVEDGLPDDRVIQIGIHSFANSRAYREWCDDHLIHPVTMRDVDGQGVDATVSSALNHLAARAGRIHVDFDIDVLDRAFAPGCPGARPGGMTPRQLARAAYLCGLHRRVASADIVEVDPSRDRDDLTIMNAATVFLSFAAGVARRGTPT